MIWKEIGDRFGVTFTTAITNDAFDNLKIIVKDNGNTAKILVQDNEFSTNFLGAKIAFSKNVETTYKIIKRGNL